MTFLYQSVMMQVNHKGVAGDFFFFCSVWEVGCEAAELKNMINQ